MGLFGKKRAKAREAEADVAEAEVEKTVGPYDEAEAPEDDELLECGALRLPPVEDATIQFTVERTTKSLIGSAASGEGLVNVYRGTGRVLMCPTSPTGPIAAALLSSGE